MKVEALKRLLTVFCIWLCSSLYLFADYQANQEKKMVVIIPSFNNKQVYQRNLDALFAQKYTNYRVIYIDDCSEDGTAEHVEQYIKEHKLEDKVLLIKNKVRRLKAANLYTVIHTYCDDDDIVVEYDGDDWFAHDSVLAYLNQLYAYQGVWCTHGGYQEYPSGREGFCRPIPDDIVKACRIREYPRTTSQLRTFYAGIFKHIKLEDYFWHGMFFPTAADVAHMLPIFEMSAERIKFNDQTVYIYNLANTINDHKVVPHTQTNLGQVIIEKERYQRLEHFRTVSCLSETADVGIFSYANPVGVSNVLLGISHSVKGYRDIYVLYIPGSYSEEYKALQHEYPEVVFINIQETSIESFKQLLKSLKSHYILCCQDTTNFASAVDMQFCINMLHKTQAYGFYFNIDKQVIPSEELFCNVRACQFNYVKSSTHLPHTLAGALYHISEFIKYISARDWKTVEEFLESWQHRSGYGEKIGLFFEEARVQEQLVSTSTRGSKKIVYIIPPNGYYNEKLFDLADPVYNRDNCMYCFYKLREALRTLGYDLKTTTYADEQNGVALITAGISLDAKQQAGIMAYAQKNLIALLLEPPTVDQQSYQNTYHNVYHRIYTFFDTLVDNKKYFKLFYPQPTLEFKGDEISFGQKKLCTLIASDKSSVHPQELYSQRKAIIQFFEQQYTRNDFEFYGNGWNAQTYKNYKGSIVCKLNVLKNYKFCICYENMKNTSGYITEKIFDALIAGCIPIYWGARNITAYIPENCLILRERFVTDQELYTFIKNMSWQDYENYIKNIKKYLAHKKAQLFSVEYFVHTLLKALVPDYQPNQVFSPTWAQLLEYLDTYTKKIEIVQ